MRRLAPLAALLVAVPVLVAPDLVAPVLAAPGASGGPVHLAPHRAVYDLSLARSGGARSVDGARGRIVFDFTGDDCRGWALQYRQVTVLDSSENGSKTSDLRNTTFESGDGHQFRFRTQSELNGTPVSTVNGAAEGDASGMHIDLREPKRDQVPVTGAVLFPTAHMRRLVDAARAGETTVSVKVFDGSDDGRKVYDTLAVIGRREEGAPADAPLRAGAMAGMARWPVTLSYFAPGEGERTPVYVLGFDLYENGISGALRLDYGDFALKGELSRIDLLPESTSCRP